MKSNRQNKVLTNGATKRGQMGQNRLNWAKWGQTGANIVKWGQTGSNRAKMRQNGLNRGEEAKHCPTEPNGANQAKKG